MIYKQPTFDSNSSSNQPSPSYNYFPPRDLEYRQHGRDSTNIYERNSREVSCHRNETHKSNLDDRGLNEGHVSLYFDMEYGNRHQSFSQSDTREDKKTNCCRRNLGVVVTVCFIVCAVVAAAIAIAVTLTNKGEYG